MVCASHCILMTKFTTPVGIKFFIPTTQILQCATANAPKFFGGEAGARIGKIESGSLANLVISESNPLDDIAHASDIDTVIKNGVVYPAS